MTGWTCPSCGRTFGRRNAGHTCAPTMTLDEWLATSPDHERPVAQRLLELVAHLPEARVEPVSVGLFVKRRSSFAQLRTMTRWTSLTLKLDRRVTYPKPHRKVQQQGSRQFHTWNLREPAELTDDLAELLGEAYDLDA